MKGESFLILYYLAFIYSIALGAKYLEKKMISMKAQGELSGAYYTIMMIHNKAWKPPATGLVHKRSLVTERYCC